MTLQKATRKIIRIFYIDYKNKRLQMFTININKKQTRNIFNLYCNLYYNILSCWNLKNIFII